MDLFLISLGISAGVVAGLALTVYIYRRKKREASLYRAAGLPDQWSRHLPGLAYRRTLGHEPSVTVLYGDAETITGYSLDELSGAATLDLDALVHPDDREFLRREITRALGSREAFKLTYRIRAKDGSWRWVSDHASLIESSEGEIFGLIGFMLDVTDRKAAEADRSRLEDRYRLHREFGRDLICLHDRDGRFVYVSPSIKSLLGYEVSELIGRNLYVLIHTAHRDAVRKQIEKSVFGECTRTKVRFRVQRKDGSFVWFETVSAPRLDENGRYSRFVTASTDVTKLARTRRALKKARGKIAGPDSGGASGLQNLSHELRTPLTAIVGYADVLAKGMDAEHRRFIEMIRQSGQRLTSSINAWMEYAALEASTTRLRKDRIDIVNVVTKEVDKMRPTADDKNISLQTVLESNTISGEIDQRALASMIRHLLDNAIKFSEKDDVVTVNVRDDGDDVILRVADTGIGISEPFLPHMFDPFQQESSGLSRNYEGIGVGLTITKELVELHGGRIRVDTEKGYGSVFSVTLPKRARQTRKTDAYRHAASANAPEDERRTNRPRLSRVLAVDDNQPMRRILSHQLSDRFEVTTASNFEEAVTVAGQQDFDVVLLDINLGSTRDGIDLLKELRAMSRYRRVPMIAVTAYALPEERLKFLRAGFDGFVGKPFSKHELSEEIGRLDNKIRNVRRQPVAA